MLVWNESEDKTFLDACIHELTTNGREGSGLKTSSWKIVREKLYTNTVKRLLSRPYDPPLTTTNQSMLFG